MLFNLKVNHLVSGVVVKALPEKPSYLVQVGETEVLGVLPREHAVTDYRIGDHLIASVFGMRGSWLFLSQNSPAYVRKMLEGFLSTAVNGRGLEIRRIATTRSADFYKVLVSAPPGEDPLRLFGEGIRGVDVKRYFKKKITPIPFSDDPERLIVNALHPAPEEEIKKIIVHEEFKRASVHVNPESAGRFLGKNGSNVSAASKLTGYEIAIISQRR